MSHRFFRLIYLCAIVGILLACNFLQPSRTEIFSDIAATIKAGTTIPEEGLSLTLTPPVYQHSGDGILAMAYLRDLAIMGNRPAGSANHRIAQNYIVTALKKNGYTPKTQPFTTGAGSEAANIEVIKPGRSPRVIIVGAHYDSVNTGSGVDDNGSGVSVLLEVSNRLKDMETPYTIHFVFFDAEETGMEGSRLYAAEMSSSDLENTIAMINLDSLAVGDFSYIYGNEGESGVIRDWSLEYAQKNGIPLITQSGKNPAYPAGTTVDASDHVPFLRKGIQYAYFEATNWELGNLDGYTQVDDMYGDEGEIWHTPYDDIDYIQSTFPGRMQAHLQLFTNVLMNILTEFGKPLD